MGSHIVATSTWAPPIRGLGCAGGWQALKVQIAKLKAARTTLLRWFRLRREQELLRFFGQLGPGASLGAEPPCMTAFANLKRFLGRSLG